ncbi:MAG: hypothetical protein ACREPP_04250, partial [Rhodanobacteraceae bacterium]
PWICRGCHRHEMAHLLKRNTRARAISPHTEDGIHTAKDLQSPRMQSASAQRRARSIIARASYTALTVNQPPLEDDMGDAAVVEAGGIAAVDAGGIAAVEDGIGAAVIGAVAAGAAMVEDAAGLPLSLLPPHAASPTTNADATTIRVSFMGSSPSRGCQ